MRWPAPVEVQSRNPLQGLSAQRQECLQTPQCPETHIQAKFDVSPPFSSFYVRRPLQNIPSKILRPPHHQTSKRPNDLRAGQTRGTDPFPQSQIVE